MASGSHSLSPPESFAVFIDTTLDTHLAMLVSSIDSVSDLKGKIRIEHALCFPNIGQITVQSLKVRRRGSFYHLADSMLVKSAFKGTKGTWFLHMDAVSAGHQGETTKNVTNTNIGHFKNLPLLDMERNATSLPPTDHEEAELQVPVREVDKAVESHLQPGTVGVTDRGEEDVGVKDVVAKAKDELVSIKKEKSRKRSNTAHSDRLLDKDGNLVEKKKRHKKEKVVPCEEPIEDPVANHGSTINSKEMSVSEIGHPESIRPNQDDPSEQVLTKDEKNKKKRKKEASKLNNDIDPTILETRPHKNPQDASMNNHNDLHEEINAALLLKKAAKNVINGDSLEVGAVDPMLGNEHTIQGPVIDNPEGTLGDKHADIDNPEGTLGDKHADLNKASDSVVTLQEMAPPRSPTKEESEVPINPRRRKKKPKHDTVHLSGDHVNKENLEASGNNEKDSRKELNEMSTIVEAIDHRNRAEGNPEVPSNYDAKAPHRSRRKKSEKIEPSNPESGDQFKDPHKKPEDSAVVVEAVILGNHAVDDSVVPSNPNDKNSRRRRKKSTKAELPNHDTIDKEDVHSLVKEANEENLRETFEDSRKEQGEESKSATIAGEVAVHENPALEESTIPSNPNDRKSRRRKKKSVEKEPIDFLETENTNDSPVVPMEDSIKEQAKEATNRDLANEKTSAAPNETMQNLVHESHIAENSSGLPNYSSNKQKNSQHSSKEGTDDNTEGLLGNPRDSSSKETTQEEKAAESIETNVHMELPKPDSDKINFVEFFVPKAGELGSAMEIESKKLDVEKPKKKKGKSNMHSEDSSHDFVNPPSLDEEHMLKKKPQNDHPGNLDLFNPSIQVTDKGPRTKRGENKRTGGSRKSDSGDTRSKLDNDKLGNKPQVSNSDTHSQASLSKDYQSNDLEGKKTSTTSKRGETKRTGGSRKFDSGDTRSKLNNNRLENKPQASNSDTHNQVSLSNDHQRNDLEGNKTSTATKRKIKSVPYHEENETMANLPASSDSTEEDTPSGKYRVSVRNFPSSRVGNNSSDVGQEKTLLATPSMIFDDAMSESSEDEFEVYNRKDSLKAMSDNSSTSDYSDVGIEETRKGINSQPHAYMDSPGVASENDGRTDEIILTQTSEAKRCRPLSKILRSTSSYRKAKVTASQSQDADSKSKPADIVLESQLEFASP